MESASDDILIMIFKVYVHELKCSPCSLLGVNHRWHILTSTTRSLWTCIDINVQSVRTILDLLFGVDGYGEKRPGVAFRDLGVHDGPLRKYLERSVGLEDGVGLPLEIKISWILSMNSTSMDEEKTLAETLQVRLPRKRCLVSNFRRALLKYLLLVLTGPPYRSDEIRLRSRVNFRRWRSLELDLTQGKCPCHHWIFPWLDLAAPEQSRLQGTPLLKSLVLRNVTTWNSPTYATSLEYLALYDSYIGEFPPMKSIKSLCIIGSSHYRVTVPWQKCTSLEELTIDNSVNMIPSFDIFPRLSKIRFKSPTNADIMQKLEEVFGSSRPLEVLGLHETSPVVISELLKKSPGLHLRTLEVDCSYYRNLPSGGIGDTITLDPDYFTPARREYVREAYKLIEDMGTRNVEVMPGNGTMEEILTIARSEELRKKCLSRSSFLYKLQNL